ncbi:MAG: hypothetical protein H8E44_29485 [Planctomycetes bacterium]|nr:hypothetical protein [Planctomycetota bacterium]
MTTLVLGYSSESRQHGKHHDLNSREELNGVFAGAAIGIAVMFGTASQSWLVFALVATVLQAVFTGTGQIRLTSDRSRKKHR